MSRSSVRSECDTFHGNNMTFGLVKLHLIKKIVAQSIRSTRSSGETASH